MPKSKHHPFNSQTVSVTQVSRTDNTNFILRFHIAVGYQSKKISAFKTIVFTISAQLYTLYNVAPWPFSKKTFDTEKNLSYPKPQSTKRRKNTRYSSIREHKNAQQDGSALFQALQKNIGDSPGPAKASSENPKFFENSSLLLRDKDRQACCKEAFVRMDRRVDYLKERATGLGGSP
ncbi:hypothetical protein KM043_016873 [Ampulex compressa]|nr:hypothetical protein KM043_016873 [Ampulex compressa]